MSMMNSPDDEERRRQQQQAEMRRQALSGTNPILGAMYAQHTSLPEDVRNAMEGAAQANAQNALAMQKRKKIQDETSGRHETPW